MTAARQTTLARPVTVTGPGLHTGRRGRVTIHPAAADSGRRLVDGRQGGPGTSGVAMTWVNRVPSVMSTSIDLGAGRTVRTIEHLMASLLAFGIDNAAIEVEGPEIPILDGSATPWCNRLAAAGIVALPAARRYLRITKPLQICRDRGFLRGEPAAGFSVDVTYDLMPAFPVMRWSGPIERTCFVSALSRSRSFGRLRDLLGMAPRRLVRTGDDLKPHEPDPTLPAAEPEDIWARMAAQKAAQAPAPTLRGARPGRAALIVGRTIVGGARYPDEPVRHVALDLIGDLGLIGAPLIGRIVANNPSHEKTYVFAAALMSDPTAWEWVEAPDDPAPFPEPGP